MKQELTNPAELMAYKIIYEVKKGHKDFPTTISELSTMILKYERKEKLLKCKIID
jgi:hypothetical protein